MNVPLAIVMLAVLGASMFVLVDSEESDAADLTIGVAVSSGSAGMGSVMVYDVTATQQLYNSSSTTISEVTIPSGHQFYIRASASTNYEFVEWRDAQNNYLTAENPIYSSTSAQFHDDLLAVFQEKTTTNYNLTFRANPVAGGTVSTSSLTVPTGTSYSSNGNTLTVGSTSITATASSGYRFEYWNPSQGSITRNQTFTAVFSVDSSSLTIGVAVSPYSTGTGSVMVYDVTASRELYNSASTTLAEVTIPGGHQFYVQAVPSVDSNFIEWRDAQNHYLTDENPINTDTSAQFHDDLFALFTKPSDLTIGVAVSPYSTGTGSVMVYDVTASRELYNSASTTLAEVTIPGGHQFYVSAIPWSVSEFVEWRDAQNHYLTDENPINSDTSAQFSDDLFAYFDGPQAVHWSNKNFNGKVDILFSFRPGTDHTITADLYAGTVDDNGLTTWAPSGYKAQVTLSFTNTLHAEAKILRNGAVWSGHTGVSDPGAWSRVLLSLDSENGRITLTPVRSFTSFTSFSLYESQERVIIDWPETTTGTATSVITHEDDGSDHARFAVVASRPFLNSYGVILYNPTINVRDYFPQYDSVRLNLFSFALYGTSMTINGHTWPVTDGKVTIQYVDLGDNQHFTPDADPTSPVKTRTFSLSNIYITWDNGRAALTFVDNRFTLDLGDYPLNQETMSFSGLWYFTTMLYEPYTAVEKTLGDWKPFPETSAQQMILIFMGITLVAGVAGMVHVRRTGRGTVDMVVIGGALLIAFIMLGAWYRCCQYSTYRI